jgi:hypothetical protein
MTVTVRIVRSDGQWVAKVPRAKDLFTWSPSLKRLRAYIDVGLREFYPELARQPRREIIELPRETRALLKDLARAERDATKAAKKAAALRRQTSKRLRSKLGISIREVGHLMGVSGARAQQLLEE